MTKRPFIISEEQTEAELQAARARNPNRAEIDDLRAQIRALSSRIQPLVSSEETYHALMLVLSKGFDSRVAAVKCMESPEIAHHLYNLFIPHVKSDIDEAVLDEAMARLGYSFDETSDDTPPYQPEATD